MAKKQTPQRASNTPAVTAKSVIAELEGRQSDREREKILRYFKTGKGQYAADDQFMGVKMGDVFAIAIRHSDMPVKEIEKLLASKIHEVRAAGVSIMDKASRNKRTSEQRRAEFFELYRRRHDCINSWDLVDLGCLHMTGSHLFDKKRDILYRWVKSKNPWERRSAMVSTCYFIRQGQLDDTYKLSLLLLKDTDALVHKACGWMLRFAGDKDPKRLLTFLDEYASVMPRPMLRNAIEKLPPAKRKHYMELET